MTTEGLRQQVFDHLSAGGQVLTATQRLARYFQADYEEHCIEAGLSAWAAPAVEAFQSWTGQQVFPRIAPQANLLTDLQAQHLWERAIHEDTRTTQGELLQVPQTARKALEAHRLLLAYDCDLPADWLTPDQEAFGRWRQRVVRDCGREGWVDPAEIPGHIQRAVAEGRFRPDGACLIVGYDEVPPEVARLARVLTDHGCPCRLLPLPQKQTAWQAALPDPETEMRQAARWARRRLQEGRQRLGIVLLDRQYRDRLERLFLEEIDPRQCLSQAPEEAPISFSLGGHLAEEGVIASALFLLGLESRSELEEVSRLLRSPYVAGGWAERHHRARLDAELRDGHAVSLSLTSVARRAADRERPACPVLGNILLRWLKNRREGAMSPAQWAQAFDRELRDLGWPGDRGVSSREFQAIKAWRGKVLPHLIGLAAFPTRLSRSEALRLLGQVCRDLSFQVEAPQGAIQVSGALEAAGLSFDGLWVLGCIEELLPQAPRPNPFLPRALQAAQRMPHATAERELEFARQLVGRLAASSDEVIFSHPAAEGDCPRRPSPLIRPFPAFPLDGESGPGWAPVAMIQTAAPELDVVDDLRGPAVPADSTIQGGTALIKDQALCPFRAFGHYRLQTRGLGEPEIGLDATLRGTLVHRALEHFWKTVRTSVRLREMGPEERQQQLQALVGCALDELLPEGGRFPEALLELETSRLVGLLAEWLALEESRPPFEVLETEAKHRVTLGQMHLKMIVDRVDRAEDGQTLILDYKTGTAEVRGLHPEQLTEPQLPLYATRCLEQAADGVLLAQVRRGKCRFQGITRESGLLDRIPGMDQESCREQWGAEGWTDLLARWDRRVEQLADDFRQGEAAVQPLDGEATCQWCDLGPLCRIAEATARAGRIAEGEGA